MCRPRYKWVVSAFECCAAVAAAVPLRGLQIIADDARASYQVLNFMATTTHMCVLERQPSREISGWNDTQFQIELDAQNGVKHGAILLRVSSEYWVSVSGRFWH